MRLARDSRLASAIIAVIALYGVVLQGFVRSLVPVNLVTSLASVICSHDGGGANHPNGDFPNQGQFCCTLACDLTQHGPAPGALGMSIVHPERATTGMAWTGRDTPRSSRGATYAGSARGPPVV